MQCEVRVFAAMSGSNMGFPSSSVVARSSQFRRLGEDFLRMYVRCCTGFSRWCVGRLLVLSIVFLLSCSVAKLASRSVVLM